jgi:hypothetical protein
MGVGKAPHDGGAGDQYSSANMMVGADFILDTVAEFPHITLEELQGKQKSLPRLSNQIKDTTVVVLGGAS